MKNMKYAVWCAAGLTLAVIVYMIVHLTIQGCAYIRPSLFAWHYTTTNVSLVPAAINTLTMAILALCVAVPCGVGAAIYLTEYAPRGSLFVKVVRVAAETLAGIPSIVYGLFGAIFFVRAAGLGMSVWSGALTLATMILPLILRTSEEAIQAVPDLYREGSFGLGAGRVRTVFSVVLPAALPGVFAGVLLGVGRIVGESAALVFTSGTVAQIAALSASGRTLAVHLYAISGEGLYIGETYATSVVLLILVALMNVGAGLIQKRMLNHGK